MNEDSSDQALEKSASKPIQEANKKLVAPVVAVAEAVPTPPVAQVPDSGLNKPEIAPPAPGMTRLYRVEDAEGGPKTIWKDGQPFWEGGVGPTGKPEPDIPLPSNNVENQGRWFTDSKELSDELLIRIREYGTEPRPNARLFYIDIPTADVEEYRVSNLPIDNSARRISQNEKNELVLPRELADRKQVLPKPTSLAGEVAARQRLTAERALRVEPGKGSLGAGRR